MRKLMCLAMGMVALCSCQINDFHGKWRTKDSQYKRTVEFPRNSDKYIMTTEGVDHLFHSEIVYTYTYVQVSDDEFIIQHTHIYSKNHGRDFDIDSSVKVVVNGNKMNIIDKLTTSPTYHK